MQLPHGRGAWCSVVPCLCCALWVSAGAGRDCRDRSVGQASSKSRTTRIPCDHPPHPPQSRGTGVTATNARPVLPVEGQPPATLNPRLAEAGPANQAARLSDPELEALGQKSGLAESSGTASTAPGPPATPTASGDSLQAQGRPSTSFQKAAKEFHFRIVRNPDQCQQSASEESKSRATKLG